MHPERRAALERRRDLLLELKRRRDANPLRYMRWLPGQMALFTCTDKRKLLRSGNQMTGKTTAGVGETHWRCSGTHPFRADLPKPPVEIMCIGGTHTQSMTIQKKFWELVPRDQLCEDSFYDPRKGAFVGKYPRARYKNGSVVHFESGAGEVIGKAGKTLDGVWFDEPPDSERLYSEMVKRVIRRNGDIWLTFTPVNAPVGWIRGLAEDGKITDLHFPISAENLLFYGTDEPICLDDEDGTPCDQAWLDAYIASELPYEVPVTVWGEWEFRTSGALFTAFRDSGPDAHVSDAIDGTADWQFALGIDHGVARFAACATLVAIKKSSLFGDGLPEVLVLDEWFSEGETTVDQDAEAILKMVDRRIAGGWGGLHRVYGDIPHGGNKMMLGRKSNGQLNRAIARQLGVAELPLSIKTVRKIPGSVMLGWRFIHQLMLTRGHYQVHPRCTRTRECLLKYDGRPNTPESHQLDAQRYALFQEIMRGGRSVSRRVVHIY